MPEFGDPRLQIEQGFISYANSTISGSLILTTGSIIFPDLTSQSTATVGGGSGTPGGSSGQVQYNNGGNFGGIPTLVYTGGLLKATGSFSGSLVGTGSWAVSSSRATTSSFALTSSFVNTLNQDVLITGSLTVGSSSLGALENTLTLGPAPAGGAGEGGQLGLMSAGGGYTSASFLDTYQDYFRILKGTNNASTNQLVGLDLQTGNLTVAGAVTPSAWAAGDIIQMRAFKPGDSGVYTTSSAATGSTNSCFFSCSFTPKSTTSYIVVDMSAKYEFSSGASGNDEFISTLTVNGPGGTEIGFSYQKFSTVAGTERSGVLFPLLGRYTNSSTSTITLCANVRRSTADDYVVLDNTNANSMTMAITEIGR
jgi:hypothetical protein